LLLRPLQTSLDDLEVGEHALEVESLEITQRICVALDRGIREVSQDEAERILFASLLKRLGGQALPLGTVLPRNVAEAHLGVRRLLRGEDPGERVDALVRHAHRAESDVAAIPNRDREAGHRVEDGRLPRARESNESDLHRYGVVELLLPSPRISPVAPRSWTTAT